MGKFPIATEKYESSILDVQDILAQTKSLAKISPATPVKPYKYSGVLDRHNGPDIV